MTHSEMSQLFEKHHDKYLQFDGLLVKPHPRRDIAAFLLLDELLPSPLPILCSAEHDEVWLEIDTDELAGVVSEQYIIALTRCGVMLSDGQLQMFV